ncbi:MAG: ABC transporter ATP-binding protein [Clostridia bacterium]|nr:ABC transporter ATP-binding protein [Clostridia bacterium]
MKILKRFYSYFKPYMGIMILYLLIGIVIVSLAMILPQITKYLISSVIGDVPFSFFGVAPERKEQLFLWLAVSWMTVVLLRQSLSYLRSYLMTDAAIRAVCKLREDLFEHMLWQSQSFLHRENTGNLLTIVNGDVELIKTFFTGTVPAMIEALFGFVFASIMVARMSWLMVAVAYVFVIPLFLFSRRFGRVFFKWYHFVRESSANLAMVTQENINGIRIVKAYAQEEQEKKKFEEKNEAFRYHAINYMVIWAKYYVPFSIISNLPNIVLTLIAALLVINGSNGVLGISQTMTVAEFVAVGGYVGYLLVPFQQANNWLNQAQQAATSAEKVFRFFSTDSAIRNPKKPQHIAQGDIHLKMEHVSFSINRNTVLKDISIDLPQGKTLGIMGATGSGKSMITNMMARFYDPSHGEVTVNGVNIKNMDLTRLRSCFAPVLQDVFLFSDTIAKNIAFGKPDATYDDVRRCAEIAQADEFIRELPDEYDTIVGERGIGLSGGQKQRISIARALLFDAPILIFDDATSALDMETEQALYRDLNTHCGAHSRVIIAHRVSSVKDCDEIILLDHGQIVERGTHDELLAAKGRYYEIYREQYSTVPEAL